MNVRAEELRWQSGGRGLRIRTLIISDDRGQRGRLETRHDTVVVATPLELIFALEECSISTVILAGRFVFDFELAAFVREFYPSTGLDYLGAEAN